MVIHYHAQLWNPSELSKRQVKAPKIFIRDSGLLHALLNLATQRDLEGHPKLGASWEGFVIDQIVQQLGVNPDETYHWRTHQGAELDLLIVRGVLRLGFEVKRTVTPALTTGREDLRPSEARHRGHRSTCALTNARRAGSMRPPIEGIRSQAFERQHFREDCVAVDR